MKESYQILIPKKLRALEDYSFTLNTLQQSVKLLFEQLKPKFAISGYPPPLLEIILAAPTPLVDCYVKEGRQRHICCV
jgi:hypothetical protein